MNISTMKNMTVTPSDNHANSPITTFLENELESDFVARFGNRYTNRYTNSRRVAHKGRRIATRVESLLWYLHRNKVDKSPLGSNSDDANAKGSCSKRTANNTNMNMVFGSRPPMHTLFVLEEKLHSLLLPRKARMFRTPSPPASVVLLRTFLR
jgi:hypothetical protein